jgi:hypothetical protein
MIHGDNQAIQHLLGRKHIVGSPRDVPAGAQVQ